MPSPCFDPIGLSGGAFLLVVAFEELLKARICLRPPASTWKGWWGVFRDDATKLEEARRLAPEAPLDMVKTLTMLRERCLYADVKEDGDPLTPRGLIDPGGLEGQVLLGWATWIQEEGLKTVRELEATRPAPRTSP